MVAIITQARVNSSRLPNKIFKEAKNVSFLSHHISRLRETDLRVIIATTNNGSEQPIVAFCESNGLDCFCGDENNVLKRFYECAKKFGVTTIIRVTSDCPLIDPAVITQGLSAYQKYNNENVYYSNTIQRMYPRGMDYEIFSFKLLEEAFLNATDDSDKEHVTPYIWKNTSGNIQVKQDAALNEDCSNYRITLDTTEDNELLTKLIEEYDAEKLDCRAIIEILKEHPQLVQINNMIEQKKV
jgi:spore coat polysaccharide biosynthesis protein SpsF